MSSVTTITGTRQKWLRENILVKKTVSLAIQSLGMSWVEVVQFHGFTSHRKHNRSLPSVDGDWAWSVCPRRIITPPLWSTSIAKAGEGEHAQSALHWRHTHDTLYSLAAQAGVWLTAAKTIRVAIMSSFDGRHRLLSLVVGHTADGGGKAR